MEIHDLIRIMVTRWLAEDIEGRWALVRLAQSLGIEDAFLEARALAEIDQ